MRCSAGVVASATLTLTLAGCTSELDEHAAYVVEMALTDATRQIAALDPTWAEAADCNQRSSPAGKVFSGGWDCVAWFDAGSLEPIAYDRVGVMDGRSTPASVEGDVDIDGRLDLLREQREIRVTGPFTLEVGEAAAYAADLVYEGLRGGPWEVAVTLAWPIEEGRVHSVLGLDLAKEGEPYCTVRRRVELSPVRGVHSEKFLVEGTCRSFLR
ncbi:MAG: hypothetical protein H6738_18545 [Alphaproteobacteria bacterium]|nr:hypothetical protein [Alphaproteobacteria bacterium]